MKEELETIFFYLRNKRYAISKMKTFIAPLDNDASDNMQVIYSLYLYSLFSLIDYIQAKLEQKQLLEHIYNILGSKDNYKYVRELRNSIIHRGLDVSNVAGALTNTNIIVPYSPIEVTDRNNPNTKYRAFTENLYQLVFILEQINPFIFDICKKNNILEYEPLTKDLLEKNIENSPYIPDFAKRLSKQININYNEFNEDLKQIHNEKITKYFNTTDLFQIEQGVQE